MAAEASLQLEGNQVNETWGEKSCTLGMDLLHSGMYSEAAAREMPVTTFLAIIEWYWSTGVMANAEKALALGTCRCSLHSDHEFLTGGQASQGKMSVFKLKGLF